ncbi:MAG: mevalonate kinase family protein [Bacteroidota bacterium]
MAESTITVQAPGKLILLGEYVVLEDAPALVAAVNKHCTVRLEPRYDSVFHFEAPNLELPGIQFVLDDEGHSHVVGRQDPAVYNKLGFVFSILNYVTLRSDQPIPGAEITVDTTDFYHPISADKFGLGSSAALTVGLLKALNEHMGQNDWMQNLYFEALQAHRIAQGKLGSGVDIAASVTGGVLRYRMPSTKDDVGEAIQPMSWSKDLHMIPIWTGSSASTRNLVNKVKRFREAAPNAYTRISDRMHLLSEQGCEAFGSGNLDVFMDIVGQFAEQEKILGTSSGAPIVSEVHERITRLVANAGGVYKPSGAGGGDIGVAFCDRQDIKLEILHTIQESSFEVLDLTVQPEGVKSTQTYEVS